MKTPPIIVRVKANFTRLKRRATAPKLSRFIRAQKYFHGQALSEIRRGRKESHWMWFIFPQIDGLGESTMTEYFAIKSRKEAEEYLKHPVLGERLLEISEMLLELETDDAGEVMGYPDNLKLQSSMTLFREVAPDKEVFQRVLDKFFHGEPDQVTIRLMQEIG